MAENSDVWWFRQDGRVVTLGFQSSILKSWGTLRFLDLPLVGAHLIVGDRFVTVEAQHSLTYASSPVAGQIIAINPKLNGWVKDGVNNQQWLVKINLDSDNN